MSRKRGNKKWSIKRMYQKTYQGKIMILFISLVAMILFFMYLNHLENKPKYKLDSSDKYILSE